MSIKYYHLAKDEELPDEFGVVENVGGEPEIRAWYSRNDQLTAENAKLRQLVQYMHRIITESCAVQYPYPPEPVSYLSQIEVEKRMHEIGIEVCNA